MEQGFNFRKHLFSYSLQAHFRTIGDIGVKSSTIRRFKGRDIATKLGPMHFSTIKNIGINTSTIKLGKAQGETKNTSVTSI